MKTLLKGLSIGVVTAMLLGSASAQNMGGGTNDLQNGAAGSNQPSSYNGQRSVPALAPPPDAGDDDIVAAPPPAPKKKKKKAAARKPKAPVAAPADD